MENIANTGSALLDRAAKGWTAELPEVAHGVVYRFRDALRAEVEVIECGCNFVSFIADLNAVRLSTPVHKFTNVFLGVKRGGFSLAESLVRSAARSALVNFHWNGLAVDSQ